MSKCWRIMPRVSLGAYNRTRLLAPPRNDQTFSTVASQRSVNSQFNLGHDVYISTSMDPYFNLSLEDFLFRHAAQSSPLLLIYRNSPCVVIGRHQNPWTELNFNALRVAGIPFLRRRSGGGTVYHDLGNTNYSIHVPRSSFDRRATGNIALRAVRSLGIDASLNDRNDIVLGRLKMRSAYKIVNKRAYHHGTMLISTKLDTLGQLLHPPKQNIVSKAVSSVRSEVCNLQEFSPCVTHETFTDAVVAEFCKEYGVSTDPVTVHDDEQVRSLEYIRHGMAELSTWEWIYGQTPEFTRSLIRTFPWGEVTADIQSKHGIIHNFTVHVHSPHLSTDVVEDMCRRLYRNRRLGVRPDEGLNLGELGREFATGVQHDDWTARQCLVDIAIWIESELGY